MTHPARPNYGLIRYDYVSTTNPLRLLSLDIHIYTSATYAAALKLDRSPLPSGRRNSERSIHPSIHRELLLHRRRALRSQNQPIPPESGHVVVGGIQERREAEASQGAQGRQEGVRRGITHSNRIFHIARLIAS